MKNKTNNYKNKTEKRKRNLKKEKVNRRIRLMSSTPVLK